MRLRFSSGGLAQAARVRRRTVRLRLTLLYSALFLLSAIVLLTITNVLVRNATKHSTIVVNSTPPGVTLPARVSSPATTASAGTVPQGALSGQPIAGSADLKARLEQQYRDEMRQLLDYSELALAGMAVISIVLGWWLAGRVLRPLRVMTSSVKEISATNLGARLALDGPDDELKDLGQTFNGPLERLKNSFDSQRRFIANASHELRTPLARQRTIAQVALADPNATEQSLRTAHERVLASGAQQERLIEALLTLARGEAELERPQIIDLSLIADSVLLHPPPHFDPQCLSVVSSIRPALLSGDPALIERLVSNLFDNAIRHNLPDGHIQVTTEQQRGRAILAVSNTGPLVPPSEVNRLFQPFQQMSPERTTSKDGVGLGLSIVSAIAATHGATLDATAQPEGGLRVEVTFPPPTDNVPHRPPVNADPDSPPPAGPA